MTLVHMASQVPLPDRLYQGRVQLVEVKLKCSTTTMLFLTFFFIAG